MWRRLSIYDHFKMATESCIETTDIALPTTGLWRADYCQVGYITYGLLLCTCLYFTGLVDVQMPYIPNGEGELFQYHQETTSNISEFFQLLLVNVTR
jgi:hypothetical protein